MTLVEYDSKTWSSILAPPLLARNPTTRAELGLFGTSGLGPWHSPSGKIDPNYMAVGTQETPGEHQNSWQMDVHPPHNGAIGYAPWLI